LGEVGGWLGFETLDPQPKEKQMDVGIGLPNAVPGTSGTQLVEWARRADGRGFSSLGTIDRIVYDNYEVLTALAAAAAVTERIGLCTSVLLGPLRENPVELAKQALSVHALSGGRLTLGIGLGGRDDDYAISGIETKGRGKRLDEMRERMQEIWDGDEVGPSHAGAPRVVIGGAADATFARVARFGEGWIAGGSSPEEYGEMAGKVKAAWSDVDREGEPRLMGLAYFALGDAAERDADAYLTDYYAWLGEETAGYIAGSAAKDAETVQQYVSAFADAGCGELIFCPSSNDPDQVDLLADALGN
jgi:alkanesulfonate monooxygenase SsuD/methylene tetrahydromethanopterin reductase-like flavin-dependent oxidoreductase (luciferase family)